MLELKDIGITFNAGTPDENEALKNINLKINDGDFITVIGSNGAGKSTLYNIISGNMHPSHGTITLDSEDITNEPEYKRAKYMGHIFQNPLHHCCRNQNHCCHRDDHCPALLPQCFQSIEHVCFLRSCVFRCDLSTVHSEKQATYLWITSVNSQPLWTNLWIVVENFVDLQQVIPHRQHCLWITQ